MQTHFLSTLVLSAAVPLGGCGSALVVNTATLTSPLSLCSGSDQHSEAAKQTNATIQVENGRIHLIQESGEPVPPGGTQTTLVRHDFFRPGQLPKHPIPLVCGGSVRLIGDSGGSGFAQPNSPVLPPGVRPEIEAQRFASPSDSSPTERLPVSDKETILAQFFEDWDGGSGGIATFAQIAGDFLQVRTVNTQPGQTRRDLYVFPLAGFSREELDLPTGHTVFALKIGR